MKKETKTYLAAALVFTALMLGALSNILSSPIDHNEHMYVAAGVLAAEGSASIYRDFAFLQMPYLPVVYGALYKLTGGSHLLLAARLASFVFIFAAATLVFTLAWKITRDRFFTIAALALFVLNDVVIVTMQEASNYVMPAAFSIAAFYFFTRGVNHEQGKANPSALFVSGLALGLAVGAKLYYAALVPSFFIAAIMFPAGLDLRARLKTTLLPLAVGTTVALLPAFYYLARDPGLFFFYNLGFHSLNAEWLFSSGAATEMGLIEKIVFGWRSMLELVTNAAIFVGVTYLFLVVLFEKGFYVFKRPEAFLSLLCLVFTIAAYFAPAPLRVQYAALPVPFAIILMCSLYASLAAASRPAVRALVIVLIIVSISAGRVRLYEHAGSLFTPGAWTGSVSSEIGLEIARRLEHANVDGGAKVATLSPLFALEGGLPIYKELATGPFLYRVGDLLTGDERHRYKATSPRTIEALLAADPPAAILTGFEGALDAPLEEFALVRGYLRAEWGVEGVSLYIRPEAD